MRGAVGVVVLQEGDERGGHGDDLLGRDVHELHALRGYFDEVVAGPHLDALLDELALGIQARIGLGNDKAILFIGGEVFDAVADVGANRDEGEAGGRQAGQHGRRDLFAGRANGTAARALELFVQVTPFQFGRGGRQLADHALVGRADEAEFVDDAVGGQAADEADVGPFRSFDGADAAVVAVVDVAHVEAGAVPAQAAGAQSAQAALVGEFRQRIGLVHELAELAAAEELLHGRHHGADIDEGAGRGLFGIGDGHAFADYPLHAQEADAELVLN